MQIAGTFKTVRGGLGGRPARRVLGIWVDGNVVQLAETRRDPETGRIVIGALVGHEDERMLEVVEKIRHPIFMDVQRSQYPEPKRVADIVRKILDIMQPETVETVGCMAGENVRLLQTLCDAGQAPFEQALHGLLTQVRINNPLLYPIFFTVRRTESATPDGQDQILLSVTHYAEIREFLGLLNELPLAPVALSNSRQAFAGIARLLAEATPGEAVLVTDVGRLRTHYVGTSSTELILNHIIPVGIARDGQYLFRALPWRMKEAVRLSESTGPLLMAPELTPPSLLGPAGASPQMECTHTASQAARYLNRAIEQAEQTRKPSTFRHCLLAGLPSRLPGFRKFMQSKVGRALVRPEHLEIDGLGFGRKELKRRFADILTPLGATLRALGASPAGITALPFDKPPMELGDRVTIANLEPGVIYQVNQPFKII